ncbi:GntR family transcriptional regulator [Burkholderia sp. Bp9142]|uniref:GntR family transcriptional regulator n=1 Tax=Burkholderia sp. Bp9142 TaxID=2184573 RepID=UPI000F591CCC|nr:GntR family transcriptional regulator [Burkholderia sp. Bp9142]RQR36046.1 GntR family transcriptional regulator [Burkholderia sp. Bp9142]
MSSVLAIPKVVKQTMGAQAVEVLRQAITRGDIPAGSRITEVQLSAHLDLSRATVRGALHQLAKEGLTKLVPYTGWTVVALTSTDAWELYTLRSSLERLAAQLVASSLDSHKRKTINSRFATLEKCCARADAEAIAEADFALHKSIIELADHERLRTQYEIVERQIRIFIRSSDQLASDPQHLIDQHRPIVQALLAKDIDEAGRLSEAHNVTEGSNLRAHLLSLESQQPASEHPGVTGRLKNLNARRHKET